jgi:hypothetical protein
MEILCNSSKNYYVNTETGPMSGLGETTCISRITEWSGTDEDLVQMVTHI